MHICFVNLADEYYSPVSGGALSTIVAASARELETRGHDVTIVSATSGPTHPWGRVMSTGRVDGAGTFRRAAGRLGRLLSSSQPPQSSYVRRAQQALKRIRVPDVVICMNDLAAPRWVREALPGVQTCTWAQNDLLLPVAESERDLVLASLDTVAACSGYIADRLLAQGVPGSMVAVVPSGVDLDAFKPRPGWLEARKPVRVLCMGRFDPNKGHDVALRAVQAAQRSGLPVTATLAGAVWWYGSHRGNAYAEDLARLLAAVGGQNAGLVSRAGVPGLVADHDIAFVLSRSQEPFGLVALESMAGGCAVVASPRGGLPEACGGAAILVDPDDQDAVSDALRRLVADSAWLADRKQAARARAENAPWSGTVTSLLRALGHV